MTAQTQEHVELEWARAERLAIAEYFGRSVEPDDLPVGISVETYRVLETLYVDVKATVATFAVDLEAGTATRE